MTENKPILFLDEYHGFWRYGFLYKEGKKYWYVKDILGKKYKIEKKTEGVKPYDKTEVAVTAKPAVKANRKR